MPMEVSVIVLPNGEIQFMVDGDVDFDGAKAITEALVQQIGSEIQGGMALDGEPEQHKGDKVHHAHIVANIKASGG